jgi:hypothetical protein
VGNEFEMTEEFALTQWQEIAKQLDALVAQTQDKSAFRIEAGSELAGDDTLSHPYRVSQCAHGFINAGMDHMHSLKTLILDVQILHAASDWTLLRAALEHFAVAFWVLNPSDRRIRIERALRCEAQNFKGSDKATTALGVEVEYSLQSNLDSLAEVAGRAGCNKKGVRAGYASTEVLEYVHREASISPSPYVMWQVGSGFAHGRRWANLSMNDVETNPTAEEGVSAVRATSDYKRLLSAGFPASQLMTEAVRLFTDRARG